MGEIIKLATRRSASPIAQNGKVAPPRRRKNVESRSREYLTPTEVQQLLKGAAKSGRYGQRDKTLVMLTYRHALRVSEVVTLRWDQIDLQAGLKPVPPVPRSLPPSGSSPSYRCSWPDLNALFVFRSILHSDLPIPRNQPRSYHGAGLSSN